MTITDLFGGEPTKRRRAKAKPPAVLPRWLCPVDGAILDEWTTSQPALLRHGGYGATLELVHETCPQCGWTIQRSATEVRP